MVDYTGQADIRGLNVDKMVKGFADEALVLKNHVSKQKTSAREIRYYTKPAGFLDSTDTTAITASQIANISDKSRFPVVGQGWTRNTTYVRKYGVESETISIEDIKDSDVDVLMTTMRDLTLAVLNQVDTRIYNVLSESLSPSAINTAAAVGTGWDDTTNGDPIKDITVGLKNIRTNRYDVSNCKLYIHPTEYQNLINFLIVQKGSSIPEFASERVRDGAVHVLLGVRVYVSVNATTDYALMGVFDRACTWKSFVPIKAVVMDDPGIGKKIRVWEEGEAILHDPKAVHLITDTVT